MTRFPVLPLAAVSVLALGIAYLTLHAPHNDIREYRKPPAPLAQPRVPLQIRSRQVLMNIPSMGFEQGPEQPPPGLDIQVAGSNIAYEGTNRDHIHPPPANYEAECNWIERSAEALAVKAVTEPNRVPNLPPGPYQDITGAKFTPRQGLLHYAIAGWPGQVSGWIPSAMTDQVRQQLLQAAHSLLQKAKRTQDEALSLKADPAAQIVLPPPGFAIQFYGRHVDRQDGPHITFLPLDAAAVRARLELAIRSAIERDGQPPKGRWTEDRQTESKIPWPRASHVEVYGPRGSWTFDIPTDHAWSPAAAAAIRANSGQVEKQIGQVDQMTNNEPIGN